MLDTVEASLTRPVCEFPLESVDPLLFDDALLGVVTFWLFDITSPFLLVDIAMVGLLLYQMVKL